MSFTQAKIGIPDFVVADSPDQESSNQATSPTPLSTPVVGASVAIADLPLYLDWLAADQRDLELWDPAEPHFLINGWRSAAAKTHALLSGYPGQISIHGPYQSLTLFAYDPLIAAIVADRLRCALYAGCKICPG